MKAVRKLTLDIVKYVQGYFAHKKPPTRRILPWVHASDPRVVLLGWARYPCTSSSTGGAVSCERGNHVRHLHGHCSTRPREQREKGEREFSFDNLLVRILVDRPCVMGVRLPLFKVANGSTRRPFSSVYTKKKADWRSTPSHVCLSPESTSHGTLQ